MTPRQCGHSPVCADAAPMRPRRRAYTLIEVVGATALFVLTVVLLAGTTASVISSRMSIRRTIQIDAALDRMIDQVATNSFSSLLQNSFDPPSRCPGDPQNAGTLARTCTTIGASSVAVTWAVTPGADSANPSGPLDASDDLTITAQAVRPDGSVFSRTRVIAAPLPAYRPGFATLRVLLNGDATLLDTPLLLLSGTGFDTIVDARRPSPSGTLMLRAPATACTTASPCRVGLAPGLRRGMSDSFTLDANTAVGPSGLVALSETRLTDLAVTVKRVSQVVLTVDATHPTGKRHTGRGDQSPESNSVCAWLTFKDGYATQNVPSCNSDGASIRFSSYDPAANGVLVGIPSDVSLTLGSDSQAQNTCPVVPGQRFANGPIWSTVSTVGVCSSWTWGRPARLIVPSDASYSMPANVKVAAGSVLQGVLEWDSSSDATGSPASGWGSQPTFSKPRSASLCPTWPAGCAPTWISGSSTTSPETTASCPSAHCLSTMNAGPALAQITYGPSFASTAEWPYAVVAPVSQTTVFRAYVQDMEADAVSATLLSLPTTGSLQLCNPTCASASVGQSAASGLSTTSGVSSAFISFQYTASSSTSATPSFTLRLSDGTTTRDEMILLPSSAQAVAVQPLATSVAQAGAVSLHARVFSSSGALTSGTPVFAAPPSGSSISSITASTASGWSVSALAGGTASQGTSQTLAGLGNWPQSIFPGFTLATRQKATGISFSSATPVSVQQSRTAAPALTLVVRDAAGAVMPYTSVSLETNTAQGTAWRGVWLSPSACTTDQSGVCKLPTLNASAAAAAGTGSLVAVSSQASGFVPLSVSQIPSRVLSSSPNFAQGTSGTFNLTVTDAGLVPVAGQTVSLSAPSGVTLSTTDVKTGSSGLAAVGVSVSASAPAGTIQITATVSRASLDDLVVQLPLRVTSTPSSASLSSATVNVTRGAQSYIVVRVLDATGSAAPGAYIAASCSSATLTISSQVSSSQDGTAVLNLYSPPTGGTGTTTCSVTVGALAVQTFQAVVS
jgi:hypothetical protein